MIARASFDLGGKRALVAGGGRGIGRACAEALASAGAEVVLCARSKAEVEEAAEGIRAAGLQATAQVVDLLDTSGFAELVRHGAGPLDIFVNSVGVNRPKPLLEVSEDDFDHVLGSNLRAAYFATQAVARSMVGGGIRGSIINISSQMGHVGAPNRSLYCASKWAVEGMTRALAVELAGHGVRVNTVCPTFVETELTKGYLADAGFMDHVLGKIKLGRLAQVEDVVGSVVYLASDMASMVTGTSLLVDGGWTAD